MEEYREEKKAAGNRFRETEREREGGGSIFLFNTGPSLKRTVHVFDEPRTKGGWLLDSGDRGRLSRLASVTAWGQQVGRQAGQVGVGRFGPCQRRNKGDRSLLAREIRIFFVEHAPPIKHAWKWRRQLFFAISSFHD